MEDGKIGRGRWKNGKIKERIYGRLEDWMGRQKDGKIKAGIRKIGKTGGGGGRMEKTEI
jgi:hypothetical protein